MADYNYHRPDIVGQEWVPILDAHYEPDITIERGYSFTATQTGAPLVLNRGIYHVHSTPAGVTTSQVPFVAVTPKSREYPAGPIMKTVIPCSQAINGGTHGAFFGGLTGAQAFQNASDGAGFNFTTGAASVTASGTLELAFDVSASAIASFGSARIFNVSFIYTAAGNGVRAATLPNFMQTSIVHQGTFVFYGNGILEGGASLRGDTTTSLGRISFGEINPNWSNATYQATNDRYPWTVTRLALFDESVASPNFRFRFNWQLDSENANDYPDLYYAALEVTWAPFENRIAYGGKHLGFDQAATAGPAYYSVGDNFVILRTASTLATGTGLRITSGEYTVTTHLADLGDMNQPLFGINAAAATNTRPTFNAIRELYQEPPIQGVEIDRVVASTDVFDIEESAIIPAVGVTVTGDTDVYSGCHGYQYQTQAFAFILTSATQQFQSVNLNGSLPYPWVRFYARLASGEPHGGIQFADAVGANNTFVRITGEELLALPEIVDGWREVTLRFEPPSNVPVMDGTTLTRNWVWSVFGIVSTTAETSYEIMAAASSTIMQDANYQTSTFDVTVPFGKATTADATFLFSTDPPAVTGLGVTPATFAVTGIGTECGVTPRCIPDSVPYNRVTWTPPNFGTTILDTFDRDVASGWGSTNTGEAWTNTGGAASDYSVSSSGSYGIHTHTGVNVGHHSVVGPTTLRDFDAFAEIQWPSLAPLTAPYEAAIIGRFVNTSNYYYFRTRWTQADVLEVDIMRVLAGVFTQLTTTVSNPNSFSAGGTADGVVSMRVQAQGSMLRVKVWDATLTDEPVAWTQTVSDTSLVAGQVGLRSELITGNTNALPVQFRFPTFAITPSSSAFGYYELQRSDELTDWQTILQATSPTVTGFNDAEARISLRSDYRIRQVNVHGFEGPWSATVSATTPAPTGVSYFLAFTSNEDQAGARALAYAEVWDGNPTEDFTYFEGGGMVQFQRMYDRDFQVGFHALERGGVQFERTLLVQNAAVAPPVLETAFRSLRDLAWENLDYVCVRTNAGDRWLAVVEVPSGTISRGRKLQLVQVRITEASTTSSIQDVAPPFTFASVASS
jgi:hypothetical protein